jgi:YD repeat-containing protein
MQSPLQKTATLETPNGLVSTISTARAVTLSDPANPLSLVNQTDTVTVNGRDYTTVYDAATRTFTTTSPEVRQDFTLLDAQGRVTQVRVPGLDPVNIAYDPRGRLDSIRQGSGADERFTVFSYKPNGYLDTVTDSLNRVVRFEYNDAGRVTSQTLPDNRVISYTYDANGNLTSLTPPSRPAHGFGYTPVDLVSNYTPPDVVAGSNLTTYQYNFDRQPTLITRPDGQTISFNYDPTSGRLSTVATPTGQYTYGYDSAGRVEGISAPGSPRWLGSRLHLRWQLAPQHDLDRRHQCEHQPNL